MRLFCVVATLQILQVTLQVSDTLQAHPSAAGYLTRVSDTVFNAPPRTDQITLQVSDTLQAHPSADGHLTRVSDTVFNAPPRTDQITLQVSD